MWLAVPTNGVDVSVPCLVVAGVDGDVACVDQKWPCSQNGFEVLVTPLNGAIQTSNSALMRVRSVAVQVQLHPRKAAFAI